MNSCSFGEHEDGGENAKEEQLESTRIKIGEAREENQRLKKVLEGMIKDYQSLQMHFFNIAQHEQVDKTVEKSMNPLNVEEPEFVTLSLGKTSNEIKKEEAEGRKIQDDGEREGLDLVLMECKVQNSINASNEEADEEGRVCETSKVVKNPRSDQADEVALHANAKRARVSVRARCDAPTMSDGGQWRKYGQKVSKGNPCPRAYYRCTVAPACPVRKQVQRCLQDMSILITTYEGTHNHPLPVSAAAMASTTSAAASMLTSGPSSSRPATGMFSLASTAAAANHNLQILNQNQVYISNQAPSSSSHPTITLDLTTPRYSPTRFNFPTFESNQRYRYGSAISACNLPPQHNPSTADTIAKAIMTDQSFRSTLMAAISSYVTNNGTQGSSTLQNLNHFHTLGSSHDQEDNERA